MCNSVHLYEHDGIFELNQSWDETTKIDRFNILVKDVLYVRLSAHTIPQIDILIFKSDVYKNVLERATIQYIAEFFSQSRFSRNFVRTEIMCRSKSCFLHACLTSLPKVFIFLGIRSVYVYEKHVKTCSVALQIFTKSIPSKKKRFGLNTLLLLIKATTTASVLIFDCVMYQKEPILTTLPSL